MATTFNNPTMTTGPGGTLLNPSGLLSTPASSIQNTVTPYAQDYVANMLGNAQALANAPMPQYTGELTAGASPLEQQSYAGLSNLALPTGMTTAANNLADISNAAANQQFTPVNFTNTYTAPGAYQNTPVTTQQFDAAAAQQLMNPYLATSLKAQMDVMNQQEGAQEAQNQAKLAQSGAFGGARTSIMNAQTQLNNQLAQNQLVSSGYNTAYNNAMQQFNNQQQQSLTAQQANQQAGQFGYTQQMTQAQQQAQALQTQQANQEAANQFGATLGLQGLQAATTANSALGNIANQQAAAGLANLQAQNAAGAQQQALAQAADTANYNQYLAQLQYPQTMLKLQQSLLQGLPVTTTNTYNAAPSTAAAIQTGIASLDTILKGMNVQGGVSSLASSAISALLGGKPDPNALTSTTPPANYPTATQRDAQGDLYDKNGNIVAVVNTQDGSLMPAESFNRGTNANYGDTGSATTLLPGSGSTPVDLTGNQTDTSGNAGSDTSSSGQYPV